METAYTIIDLVLTYRTSDKIATVVQFIERDYPRPLVFERHLIDGNDVSLISIASELKAIPEDDRIVQLLNIAKSIISEQIRVERLRQANPEDL